MPKFDEPTIQDLSEFTAGPNLFPSFFDEAGYMKLNNQFKTIFQASHFMPKIKVLEVDVAIFSSGWESTCSSYVQREGYFQDTFSIETLKKTDSHVITLLDDDRLHLRDISLTIRALEAQNQYRWPVKTNQNILDLLPSKIHLHNNEKNDVEIDIDQKFSVSSYSRSFFSSLFGGHKMSFREYIKDLYNKAPDKALRIVQALREGNILKLNAALQERRIMTCFSGATVGTQLLNAMFRDFNNAALRHGLGLSH